MIDIQSQVDDRAIDIDQVGVSDLRSPIVVLDRKLERQATIASLNMSVALPHHFKGTHMSRFVEALHAVDNAFDPHALHALASSIRDRLSADEASVAIVDNDPARARQDRTNTQRMTAAKLADIAPGAQCVRYKPVTCENDL